MYAKCLLFGTILGGEVTILAAFKFILAKDGNINTTGRGHSAGRGSGAGFKFSPFAGGGSHGGMWNGNINYKE
jgi:hypothetical protein